MDEIDREKLWDFRNAYLDWDEGEVANEPSLEGLPEATRKAAKQWLESLLMCRFVAQLPPRPSTEWLLNRARELRHLRRVKEE